MPDLWLIYGFMDDLWRGWSGKYLLLFTADFDN